MSSTPSCVITPLSTTSTTSASGRSTTIKTFEPSAEQIEIRRQYQLGNNVKILAHAGSGKSSTFLLIAKSDPTRRFLLLTYNKKLQLEMANEALRQGIFNIEIRTYHSACGRAYGQLLSDDVKFINALKSEPLMMHLLRADVLMLDETQDMSIPYYLFVEKIVKSFPNLQVLSVGDRLQAINDYLKARVEFLINCHLLPGFSSASNRLWAECTLSTSYRLTPAVATFINNHLGLEFTTQETQSKTTGSVSSTFSGQSSVSSIPSSTPSSSTIIDPNALNGGQRGAKLPVIGGNTRVPNLKPRYVVPKYNEVPREIGRIAKEAIAKYGLENVIIIAAGTNSILDSDSKNPLSITVREHLVGVPIYLAKTDEVLDAKITKGKLAIGTWNSVKGQERDCVIVIGFDESYFKYYGTDWKDPERIPNILYVAATRAIKELILIADPSKTLRTMKLSRLSRDVQVTGGKILRKVRGSTIEQLVDAPVPRLFQSKVGGEPLEDKKKKTTFTITELFRHMDPDTQHLLDGMIKIGAVDDGRGSITELRTRAPKQETSKMRNHEQRFKVDFNEGKYCESVNFLYGLVVPAIVELKMKGYSQFAKQAHIPRIVQNLDKVEPFDYCITQQAYDSFPDLFWDQIRRAYAIDPAKRDPLQWFHLAIAETIFNENGHHTARQINNYRWIDEEFLKDAVSCVIEAMSKKSDNTNDKSADKLDDEDEVSITGDNFTMVKSKAGKTVEVSERKKKRKYEDSKQSANGAGSTESSFKCKFVKQVGEYEIAGVAAYVDPVADQIWDFRCVSDLSGEHVMQLACCLALSGRKVGKLHLLLSGRIVEVRLLVSCTKFLETALSRFDKKEVNDLLLDIANFRARIATGASSSLPPALPIVPIPTKMMKHLNF